MKRFRTAIHIYSCSNMIFILLNKFSIDAADKYGVWSLETWIITLIIWLLGVLVSWIILLIER